MTEPSMLLEVPTSEQYAQALLKTETLMKPTERALLSALYGATSRLTSHDLAERVFPSEGRSANKKVDDRFKSLGKLIRDAMPGKTEWEIEPVIPNNPQAYWSTIAICFDGELCKYQLLEQVRDALESLGWERPKLPHPSAQELQLLRNERQTRIQEILSRPGQGKFRDGLIAAYGKCAVTGCDAVDALEAAHIKPFCDSLSDCLTNGLLLRADIHRLFDLDLIGIDPATNRIRLSAALLDTSYRDLHNEPLFVPSDTSLRPNQAALEYKWKSFKLATAENGRG